LLSNVIVSLFGKADCVVRWSERTVGGMSEYDADILIWSEHQAELLRRVAAGEPLNEPPDWANIIEELEDVGRSELRSCRSLLRQALRHMLKAEAWPLPRDAPGRFHPVHVAEDRCGRPLCRRAACHAGYDRWSAAFAGGHHLPGHAGRTAR
jgi:hypothetical protein